jgi:hypothetical protein
MMSMILSLGHDVEQWPNQTSNDEERGHAQVSCRASLARSLSSVSSFATRAMKAALIFLGLVLLVLVVFLRAHDHSLRRATVVNSVNELLASERALREGGLLTNFNRGFRVFHYTNAVIVDRTSFQCSLAVESDLTRDVGFVAVATDGTVLWNDRELAPSIARGSDGRLLTPERFR